MTVHGTGMTTEEIIVDPIDVQQSSQEECHGITHRVSLGPELAKANSEALNLVMVWDEFDADTFDQNPDIDRMLRKMMNHQVAREKKKVWRLRLT
jgi:hypothetical protein